MTLKIAAVTPPCSTCVAALAEQALDSESIVVRINNSRCFCWSVTNSQTDLALFKQLEQRGQGWRAESGPPAADEEEAQDVTDATD